MPTGYQIDRQDGLYFLTCTVVDWVDVFSRKDYAQIILDSLKYCRKNKGLKLWAYVIMTNHIHMIVISENDNLSDVIRDFKAHTARTILKQIQENTYESRKDWILNRFAFATKKHMRNSKYQFWQHSNHAIELESIKFIKQKMAYIHDNPVVAGYVENAEDWMWSSQRNYSELYALIEIDIMKI